MTRVGDTTQHTPEQKHEQVEGPEVAPARPDGPPSELATADVLPAAVRAYEAGDLDRARTLFEQIHADAPTARTLRSLALVALRQRRLEEAIGLFEAALASPVKPLTESMRSDAVTLLAQARAEHSSAETPSTAVAVQALAPALTQPVSTPSVTAPAAAPSPEATPASRAPAASPQEAERRRRRLVRMKRGGYATLALTATTLLLSAVALGIGLERVDSIERVCRDHASGHCSSYEASVLEHAARLELLSALSISGAALAGASALVSSTLLTLYYRSGPRLNSAGLALQVRF